MEAKKQRMSPVGLQVKSNKNIRKLYSIAGYYIEIMHFETSD